jgi:amino acid adenylation domain-containing protein
MTGVSPTVWDLVREQAGRTPGAVAIHADGARLSYQELLERVDQTAAAISKVCPSGSLIALEAVGHAAAIVGILAAGRAGCAVLPLSASDPPLRREAVLRDADPAAWLHETADGTAELTVTGMATGMADAALAGVAYVMYTSGSTGKPKGVVVSQDALRARLRGLAATPGLRAGESMAALSALSFDIVMAEMLLPLVVGASVLVAPPDARLDPQSFSDFVLAQEPDVVQATPSFWRLALAWGWAGLPNGRLWCGGEALTPPLARQLLPRCGQLWNLYGPTEATIWVSCERIRSAEHIGLGRPLPGSSLFLVPTSGGASATESQIVVYGQGLARGYLNAPQETRRSFVRLDTPDGPQDCYLTGDMASERQDGSLEFLGRVDGQIKLRGHRIELGGVEAALEEHPAVSEAAAVLQDVARPNHTHIVAFVVTKPAAPSERDLRSWLVQRLPAAAVPARVITIEVLPRTTAGKVDRVRLSAELAADGE